MKTLENRQLFIQFQKNDVTQFQGILTLQCMSGLKKHLANLALPGVRNVDHQRNMKPELPPTLPLRSSRYHILILQNGYNRTISRAWQVQNLNLLVQTTANFQFKLAYNHTNLLMFRHKPAFSSPKRVYYVRLSCYESQQYS